jgi:predicted DnaQ family exonuclease/DinG family helicase
MDRIYVAIDLEFTGLDPRRDEIIEIALVKFRGDEVLDTFSSLVRSNRQIPLKIEQLVGLRNEDLRDAPTMRSLTGRILTMVANHPVVAHSVEMDQQFLRRHGLLVNNLPLDTFELASIVLPGAGRYSLANLCERLDISLPQNHRALHDAVATKELFVALVERISGWDLRLLEEVAALASATDWPLGRVFRDVAAERREASGALFASPWPVAEAQAGPVARAKEPDMPPLEPAETIRPVDPDALAALVAPGGIFQSAFPGYEHRPQQVEMVRAVAEAFNLPCHLLVEAGTGTGKSLAYLLPAAHFALQNDLRVIISSNTINLQDQLFAKDIPDIQRILGLPFRTALLKGRGNYLCQRRLGAFRRSRQLTGAELSGLTKILAWLPQTTTGERSELVLVNADQTVWAQVQASSETCFGDRCPYRRQGSCFFYRARDRAERAHLVVVNHALLLSDLAMESRVLPEYHYLIIDEAHHLEDVATDQFGIAVSRQGLYAYLADISHRAGEVPGGLVGRVPGLFRRQAVSQNARDAVEVLVNTVVAAVQSSEQYLYALFNVVTTFVDSLAESRAQSQYDLTILLTPGQRAQPDWSRVEVAWEDLSTALQRVLKGLGDLAKRVEELGEDEQDTERGEILQELNAAVLTGVGMWAGLQGIITDADDAQVYWLTIANPGGEVTLQSAPLQVGPLLEERLFSQKDCVVLTSATLQTGNSFRYIKERLGLEEPTELALDSPFDFETSVLLYVPKDIPEPNEPFYQKNVEQAIVDLCAATEGRAMVLFTSNSQLNATYRAVQGPLEEEGIVVYGQGFDGSRQQILESFRSTSRSVLLGTRSFWEGVDIVGEALSCLVIARLPFAVPTDPVFSARAATFDDPFNEFYLPDAILRFRQGFGRLIRSTDDYGLVVVLDKRLLTKSYGKTILRSLPGCTARQGPIRLLPDLARRWLDPANRG